ncbi:hypothetical protein F5B20DRAFT_526262 [Whalleya microplaca]|nr:hypothetical protein F5B20DRAFT_526262 [Whalleya microplaca]
MTHLVINNMGSAKVQSMLTGSSVLISITTFAVMVRAWARFGILRTLGLDDVLILFSWIMSLSLGSCIMVATHYGLGRDRVEVSEENYTKYLQLQIASSVSYSWGVTSAKASFAVLFLRILPERPLRILNKLLVGFLLCQAIEETFVVLFKCSPVQKSWYPQLEGRCITLSPLWYTTFAFNMITDLTLFTEPIPSMWKLQLPIVKRIGLIAMLSLGLLVTSISIIRIIFVTKIGLDDTYELADALLWSEVESCALIICSCIPSLRQVAAKIPGLNSALGLSSGGESRIYNAHSGKQTLSIPLQSHARKEYIQSPKPAARSQQRSAPYGMTAHATAIGAGQFSDNDSQEEIFPHKTDHNGGIMVTTEVRHDIESNNESERASTDASSQHHEGMEGHATNSYDGSSRAHVSKSGGDSKWPRLSK